MASFNSLKSSAAYHVLLTGLPGVGKTTLICKLLEILKDKNVPTVGFYTKEVKGDDGIRIGFDIVTLDGHVGKLARVISPTTDRELLKHKVGKYCVYISEFERLALPILVEPKTSNTVIIIDEIGMMELFSHSFIASIKKLFEIPNLKILATIPIARGRHQPLIERLRNDPKNTIITVERSNRNHITHEILLRLNVD